MKSFIEILELGKLWDRVRSWFKKNKSSDDDRFDHPFAIL